MSVDETLMCSFQILKVRLILYPKTFIRISLYIYTFTSLCKTKIFIFLSFFSRPTRRSFHMEVLIQVDLLLLLEVPTKKRQRNSKCLVETHNFHCLNTQDKRFKPRLCQTPHPRALSSITSSNLEHFFLQSSLSNVSKYFWKQQRDVVFLIV